jgi:hypothetical protein
LSEGGLRKSLGVLDKAKLSSPFKGATGAPTLAHMRNRFFTIEKGQAWGAVQASAWSESGKNHPWVNERCSPLPLWLRSIAGAGRQHALKIVIVMS